MADLDAMLADEEAKAAAQAKKFGGTVKGLFQLATSAGLKVKQPTAAKSGKTKSTTDF